MREIILTIFCDVDEFCKSFEAYCKEHLLEVSSEKKGFFPKSSMALSEIMTIVILFHLSQYRTFKWYYKSYVSEQLRDCFPQLVSYNRFVELMRISLLPLTVYMMKCRAGKCTGISFIDMTIPFYERHKRVMKPPRLTSWFDFGIIVFEKTGTLQSAWR